MSTCSLKLLVFLTRIKLTVNKNLYQVPMHTKDLKHLAQLFKIPSKVNNSTIKFKKANSKASYKGVLIYHSLKI